MVVVKKSLSLLFEQDLYYATDSPKYSDTDRSKDENEVTDEKSTYVKPWMKKKECPDSSLHSMGNRLLDWFSVIMADNKRRRVDYKGKGTWILLV